MQKNISKFPINKRIDIINHLIPILINISASSSLYPLSINKKTIAFRNSNKKVHNIPKIIFTHADKGNVTVALDKEFYIKQINDILQDKEIEILIIKKDSTRKLKKNSQKKSLKKLLSEWKIAIMKSIKLKLGISAFQRYYKSTFSSLLCLINH